jgi:PTS system ascorbate-specific IIB component
MAKLDNKKILACCANGAGSSLMMENAIKKVMERNGIKVAELRHAPVAEGKTAARNYDVVFCARTFVKTFDGVEDNGTILIPLKNVMSDKEIEAALKERDLLD